jgi:antitoxin (DNA-binding transcriptional repressor) of toxin-antitoxin stability system
MKFVSVRDFRTSAANIWKTLPEEQEMVITNKGKPIALLTPLSDKTLENTLSTIRQARTINAVKLIQQKSLRKGMEKTTMEEIDGEIKRIRKQSKKMKIVLDANIIVSVFINPKGTPGEIMSLVLSKNNNNML